MALHTEYVYDIDKKTSRMTYYEDSAVLAFFEFDNNVVTISAMAQFSVIPKWGTNKDMKEWFDFIYSIAGRIELDEGQMRDGYDYEIKVNGDGVVGKIEANGETLGDWEWVASTGLLTIASRIEQEINFAELRSFIQWMQHFQYCVQNYGG